jgi:hypothetical protein
MRRKFASAHAPVCWNVYFIFEGDTDPTPKNSKETTTILVLYSSFAALSILLVGKKFRTVATQCFFGKAELPTL